MRHYISQPQVVEVFEWTGDNPSALEIVNYLHRRPNMHAVLNQRVAPQTTRLRIFASGRVMDMMPGQFLVCNPETGDIEVVPSDIFALRYRPRR